MVMLNQDMKEPGSTNVDPIFTNNKLPDGNEPGCAACRSTVHVLCATCTSAMMVGQSICSCLTDGYVRRYPGGIFDPFGFSKSNMAEYKLKELKNGRYAVAMLQAPSSPGLLTLLWSQLSAADAVPEWLAQACDARLRRLHRAAHHDGHHAAQEPGRSPGGPVEGQRLLQRAVARRSLGPLV